MGSCRSSTHCSSHRPASPSARGGWGRGRTGGVVAVHGVAVHGVAVHLAGCGEPRKPCCLRRASGLYPGRPFFPNSIQHPRTPAPSPILQQQTRQSVCGGALGHFGREPVGQAQGAGGAQPWGRASRSIARARVAGFPFIVSRAGKPCEPGTQPGPRLSLMPEINRRCCVPGSLPDRCVTRQPPPVPGTRPTATPPGRRTTRTFSSVDEVVPPTCRTA